MKLILCVQLLLILIFDTLFLMKIMSLETTHTFTKQINKFYFA